MFMAIPSAAYENGRQSRANDTPNDRRHVTSTAPPSLARTSEDLGLKARADPPEDGANILKPSVSFSHGAVEGALIGLPDLNDAGPGGRDGENARRRRVHASRLEDSAGGGRQVERRAAGRSPARWWSEQRGAAPSPRSWPWLRRTGGRGRRRRLAVSAASAARSKLARKPGQQADGGRGGIKVRQVDTPARSATSRNVTSAHGRSAAKANKASPATAATSSSPVSAALIGRPVPANAPAAVATAARSSGAEVRPRRGLPTPPRWCPRARSPGGAGRGVAPLAAISAAAPMTVERASCAAWRPRQAGADAGRLERLDEGVEIGRAPSRRRRSRRASGSRPPS